MTTENELPATERRDAMARSVAAALAPEVGPKLPMYVEKRIAQGDDADDEAPVRTLDNAVAIALAGVVITAINVVANRIDRYQDDKRRAQEE
jgi:hypothetical protein